MSQRKGLSSAIVGVIFSLILFAVHSLPLEGAIPASERAALIALYNSTNGDGWTKKSGWKTAPLAGDGFAAVGTEGNWYGVLAGEGKVLQINLDSNNLTGSLPSELGNFPNLQQLNLNDNKITGSIPSTLGTLSQIRSLDIGGNRLTGPIPSNLGNLRLLNTLNFCCNELSGSIPSTLGNLANLEYLHLAGNYLSGNIPPQLGNLSNLIILSIDCNCLTGSIPVELCKYRKLQLFWLQGNQLTGPIPPQIGNIKSLTYICIGVNILSGTIPKEIGGLPNLQTFSMSYNQISGPIPKELGNCTNLSGLYIDNNKLSGPIPTELGRLRSLYSIWLSSNNLVGPVPSSIRNLTNLESDASGFSYNGLYAADDATKTFLTRKDKDWEATQTIAPANVTATALSSSSVQVSWDKIVFSSESGGYNVYYSKTSGGPWSHAGITSSKTDTWFTVNGLDPSTIYYFVVKSQTDSFWANQNTVISDKSEEASVMTLLAPGTHLLTVQSAPFSEVGITVSPSDNNGLRNGTTTFARVYDLNTTVTLTAPAVVNYANFIKWQIDGVDQPAGVRSLSILIDGNHTVTAVYESVFRMAVTSDPTHGARVEVSPADKNGSANGATSFSRYYNSGEQVTLTAASELNGNIFSNWTVNGAVKTGQTIRVTMNSNKNIVAVFTPPAAYNLTVQSTPESGAGITVSPADNNGDGDGSTEFSRTYNGGTVVTLAAPYRLNEKYFSKWQLDGTDVQGSTIQVAMDADHTAVAVYSDDPPDSQYKLKIQSTHGQHALIDVSPADLNGDGDGRTHFERLYAGGTTVTLTAPTTHNDKEFAHWKVDGQVITTSTTLQWTVTDDHKAKAFYVTPSNPGLVIGRNKLNFAYITGTEPPASQVLRVTINGDPAAWSASADVSWISLNPASGSGSGSFEMNVSAVPGGLSPGTYYGTITVSAPGVPHSPQTAEVKLIVYGPNNTSPPVGAFTTPEDGATVSSSVALTGWVVDDVGVKNVRIYLGETTGDIYLGEAVFVEGARPDVEEAFPDYPGNHSAGWGYMLLSHFLPNGGNGTYVISAFAEDVEGHVVSLGSKTIICDNANAVKPFGAIDSPEQGGTASGEGYVNWGWALTPQPNAIPIDGSTIDVFVDGYSVGNPNYNIFRSDIANLFPGYANSDGASGFFVLDTTPYQDGVHTIHWTVRDDAGNSDGIGSRFFQISNSTEERSTANSRTAPNPNAPILPKSYAVRSTHHLMMLPMTAAEPVEVRKGFNEKTPPQWLETGPGNLLTVSIPELQRVVIHLDPTKSHILRGAYQLTGKNLDRLTALPIGSTLDIRDNAFYWQPGAGFLGDYHMVFILETTNGVIFRKNVKVTVTPGN